MRDCVTVTGHIGGGVRVRVRVRVRIRVRVRVWVRVRVRVLRDHLDPELKLPKSPYISLHLPTSPYIPVSHLEPELELLRRAEQALPRLDAQVQAEGGGARHVPLVARVDLREVVQLDELLDGHAHVGGAQRHLGEAQARLVS